MKKYTIGEQHIYNCIMVKIRANWRILIAYKKTPATYKNFYGEDAYEFMIASAYQTIMVFYDVLESGFYIKTEKMRQALMNYRYFGKCNKSLLEENK